MRFAAGKTVVVGTALTAVCATRPMSLDVVAAVREGADRTASRNGAVFVVAVWVVALASAVAGHTLRAAFLSQFGGPVVPADPLGPVAFGRGTAPLAVPLPASLAAAVWVTALVAGESVRVVALRTFAGDHVDAVPASATRRLGAATLHSLLADLAARLLVAAGLVLLVVPGLVLAAGFAFVRAQVAVADRGVVASLTESWRLTAGERLAALGLVAAVVAAALALALLSAGVRLALGAASPALGALAALVVGSVGTVFGVATVARAFVQLSADGR